MFARKHTQRHVSRNSQLRMEALERRELLTGVNFASEIPQAHVLVNHMAANEYSLIATNEVANRVSVVATSQNADKRIAQYEEAQRSGSSIGSTADIDQAFSQEKCFAPGSVRFASLEGPVREL